MQIQIHLEDNILKVYLFVQLFGKQCKKIYQTILCVHNDVYIVICIIICIVYVYSYIYKIYTSIAMYFS